MWKVFQRFFWFCSGAAPLILEKCPSEANKYIGIGATVFFTGLFASLSGSYALFTVFKSVELSALFGLFWGAMIFNLDRYIVSSMKKEGQFWREFRFATPRLILTFMLAVVISKPLELKIFEKEINTELVLVEQRVFKEQEDQLKERYQIKIDILTKRIDGFNSQIAEKTATRDELRLTAQKEADGSGGTGQRSLGPVYQIKKQNADKADEELKRVTTRLTPLIDKEQKELAKTEGEMNAQLRQLEKDRGSYDGLAARIEALDSLSAKRSAINSANWFIFILFIVIETAPLFVKLLAPKGPYDEMLTLHEHTYQAHRRQQMDKIDRAPDVMLKVVEGMPVVETDEDKIRQKTAQTRVNP